MSRPSGMQFGLFIPPIHYPEQNPTRAIRRDIELIQHAESLGFSEAWVGEHHSSGHEIIGPNDLVIAAAVERTSRIRLGTGVVSLAYHHPFHVAERAIMLDHLSMGRTMLGVGPGSFPSDAAMLGIPWSETRRRMVEAFEVIDRLLTSDEPLTHRTDWFTLEDAYLQLRPYSERIETAFTAMESPFGPTLAGQHGGGLISLSGLSAKGYAALGQHWAVVEEQAARHGRTADRADWRIATLIHVAETREKAKEEVARGLPRYVRYTGMVGERTIEAFEPDPDAPPSQAATELDALVEGFAATEIACIGTPDDAIAMIQKLVDVTGGFGTVLLFGGTDWAAQDATHRSLELLAREVMPAFNGGSASLIRAMERSVATREVRNAENRASVQEAQAAYAAPTAT